MTNHVTVVGSLNVDTTMKVKRMPLPGETIAALSKTNAAGGKGANQAVAAARSGAETAFVGQVGDDAGGKTQKTPHRADHPIYMEPYFGLFQKGRHVPARHVLHLHMLRHHARRQRYKIICLAYVRADPDFRVYSRSPALLRSDRSRREHHRKPMEAAARV